MALETKQSALHTTPRPTLDHHRQLRLRAPRWPRRSIRARLQLSHLFTSLVPLITMGFALLYTSAQAERRVFEQTQTSVAASIGRDLTKTLEQAQRGLLNFGRITPITGPDKDAIKSATREYLNRQYPDMIELAILNLQGDEIVRVTQERIYFDNQLINRVEEPFFAAGRQGLFHHSVTGAYDGRRVFQIAVPARNGVGQVQGVIVAHFSTQNMVQNLAAVPLETARNAFIMDERGNVLLGNAPEALIGTQNLRAWARSDAAVATLLGSDGAQVTAGRAFIPRHKWSVVVEQPTDRAFYASRRSTWLLALVLVGTGVFVGVWAVLLARELTRPILQLRDGVQVLGSGQLGGTIAVAREDELGQLATEFNGMSKRLAESQQAIEQRNARLSEGLNLARIIQHDLLPHGPPPIPAVTAQAASESAAEIGGDFYTYVPLPDGRLRLVIGDASGKGVAAALVMALTSSLVEIHARQEPSPADLLMRLNAELYPRFSTSHMCVALLVAEFEPQTQQICVANAGMISPLIAGAGECFYMASYGPPLGVVADVTYAESTIVLKPEQAVVFISDGIVEARSPSNEMWGFDHLESTVCHAASGGPAQIVSMVLEALKQHVQDMAATDDMTIIATTLHTHSKDNNPYVLVPTADGVQPDRLPAVNKLP
ncbi:MAG: hypothetical protein CYG59_05655 [Chloroflexi bacterium]|nr:MAG: hypothetical protein CYG59_05655 [Chloroflexota bacterium]